MTTLSHTIMSEDPGVVAQDATSNTTSTLSSPNTDHDIGYTNAANTSLTS